MTVDTQIAVSMLSADEIEANLADFGALLHACVHAGANINFVLPFTTDESEIFWLGKVIPTVRNGTRVLWAARHGDSIAGSVQLDTDTPPNQPHRGEVTKLMVHPGFRRRGIARALMAELERHAREIGRSLITLDTRTGDKAEPLYTSLGYQTVGTIPDFCLDPIDDRLHPTTVMYKRL